MSRLRTVAFWTRFWAELVLAWTLFALLLCPYLVLSETWVALRQRLEEL